MNIEIIKNNILKSFDENRNSHAFLFVTNNIEKTYDLTLDIVKYISCLKNQEDNCDCTSCRMFNSHNNPDSVILEPDGKNIKVEQVEGLINKFNTKAAFSKKSTYIIKNADLLRIEAANKLLKFLEEPEENIVGFYITNNLQGILQTIQSRCEIFYLNFEAKNILDYLDISEDIYKKFYDPAMKLIYMLNDAPKYQLMSESKELSKYERDEVINLINLIRNMYIIKYQVMTNEIENNEFLIEIVDNISTDDLKLVVKRLKLLDNILNESKFNINKELIFNKLFVMWE